MTIQEVTSRFLELARMGQTQQIFTELFSGHVQSIESSDVFGPKVMEGLPAIREKSERFEERVEAFHSSTISEPIIAGNHFALTWVSDITFKGRGRMTVSEICVYKVEDGKIVMEQFFY